MIFTFHVSFMQTTFSDKSSNETRATTPLLSSKATFPQYSSYFLQMLLCFGLYCRICTSNNEDSILDRTLITFFASITGQTTLSHPFSSCSFNLPVHLTSKSRPFIFESITPARAESHKVMQKCLTAPSSFRLAVPSRPCKSIEELL